MNEADQAFVIGIVIGAIAMGCIAVGVIISADHDIAIRHHAAHYNAQTGAFTWNEPEDK